MKTTRYLLKVTTYDVMGAELSATKLTSDEEMKLKALWSRMYQTLCMSGAELVEYRKNFFKMRERNRPQLKEAVITPYSFETNDPYLGANTI